MDKMVAWNVYVPRDTDAGQVLVKLNTAFYESSCDAQYVRQSLIDHDGYPDAIEVVRHNPW